MSFKLRTWQSKCIEAALAKYQNIGKHFFVLACPGAGKTTMTSFLVKLLFEMGMIDYVVCVSPNRVVAHDFAKELANVTGRLFNGRFDSLGEAITYQRLMNLDDSFWQLFKKYRVFAIFDEIHHSSGIEINCKPGEFVLCETNAWGKAIYQSIRDSAAFTLSLTGTPWRSDGRPLALGEYELHDGGLTVDFRYDLKEAIKDNVCRVPQFYALDNANINGFDGRKSTCFENIKAALLAKAISYDEIIKDEAVLDELFRQADKKLCDLRERFNNAGGLIVASSIKHAKSIQVYIARKYNVKSVVVTNEEKASQELIKKFRRGNGKWLISVNMISEGTNIPRLRVLLNLSAYTTSLFFQQLLGRVLRGTDSSLEHGFMFMPASPWLLDYAKDIMTNVPDNLSKINVAKLRFDAIGESSDSDAPANGTLDDEGGSVKEIRDDEGGSVREIGDDEGGSVKEISDDEDDSVHETPDNGTVPPYLADLFFLREYSFDPKRNFLFTEKIFRRVSQWDL